MVMQCLVFGIYTLYKPEKFLTKKIYNDYFSLLPLYRGMYTSALLILDGREYSRMTLHCINQGNDTGDIMAQRCICFNEKETCRSLYLKYIGCTLEFMKKYVATLIFCLDKVGTKAHDSRRASYYFANSIDYKKLSIDLKGDSQCHS